MAGVNQPGVSYQFLTALPTRWAEMDDWSRWLSRPKVPRAATQLAQSGYAALLPPYVLVGLGQTNDYVEALEVGVPSGHVRRFSQAIMPNSRLVVIPYPYNATYLWQLRLYLEPRQQLWVGLALCGALVLVGLGVLALEIHERVQDRREKRMHAHALPLG